MKMRASAAIRDGRRRRRVRFIFSFFAAGAVGLFPLPSAAAEEFEKGKVIEKVACLEDSGRSYALYLPSAAAVSEKSPVLFLFDPAARGAVAVKAFQPAAEKYGWILVGSNDSQNGPLNESAEAARAAWNDVAKRLPVDGRRVYAAGFSGGARVASIFPQVIARPVAGIIGCGAGLAVGLDPKNLRAGAYFGLTGLRDFNYEEMKKLDLDLDPAGIPHRLFFFEGVHDWPDPGEGERAVAWMEVEAMKAGLRPKEPALARSVVDRELEEAGTLERDGREFWAVERLEAAGRLAEGLVDLPGHAARVEALKAGRAVERFLKEESKRDRKEEMFRAEFGGALGRVEGDEAGGAVAVSAALRDMGIGFLLKEASSGKTVEDRAVASRLLFLFSFAAQARAGDLFGKGAPSRVAAYLDLALAACEEGLSRKPYLYFSRARVAGLMGDGKRALEYLSAAADRGYSDFEFLESAKELDGIRDDPRYAEIREKIRLRSKS